MPPGRSILEQVAAGLDAYDGAARWRRTDVDCSGFGTGRRVPANLVFGELADDDMCILPGLYYPCRGPCRGDVASRLLEEGPRRAVRTRKCVPHCVEARASAHLVLESPWPPAGTFAVRSRSPSAGPAVTVRRKGGTPRLAENFQKGYGAFGKRHPGDAG